ncbi:hypothetical protein EBN03_00835 [Nocardia stercoris]|uniref:Uncharacterized protein n=1 Tax=Nocardia stercoris TaxID=2483361 RepID=A0A3M2LE73_9NOCA|nr:hypothetical protein EBN03_00835 [Nocardia stercoris]
MALLARTLHVRPDRLRHLLHLGTDRLHELQKQVSEALFDEHKKTFRRFSAIVPYVPLSLTIPMLQRVVPPVAFGRAAGALAIDHPETAARVIPMLDPGYMSECLRYIDLRSVERLTELAPVGSTIDVVNEIMRRGDYLTGGPLLGCLTPPVIAAIEAQVHDDVGLIYSAAYSYGEDMLSAVVRQLLDGPHRRIPRMVHTVLAGPPALQRAALSLISRCAVDVNRRMADILLGGGQHEAVAGLVRNAVATGSVPELLSVAGHLTPVGLWTLVGNPVFAEPEVVAGLIAPLDGSLPVGAWRGLFTVLSRMDEGIRGTVGDALAALDDATVAELPAHATETACWPGLLDLIAASGPDAQHRFGVVWASLGPERRAHLHRCIAEHNYDTRLAEITAMVAPVEVEELFFQRRRMQRHRWG